MKMIVSAASRMLRAISFGVLRRDALSTSSIMRSRNVSPGLAVISTTMRSESTRVPPVTEVRSPPASRMTGADSPVIADSSTEAMPSTTSPSPGIRSPASQTTWSPLTSAVAGTRSSRPSTRRRAMVSLRVLRSEAAWALPRPSATASAKLAKRTVNHSQTVTWPTNSSLLGPLTAGAPLNRPAMKTMVVITDPTSTTNITGLRAIQRGSSFLKLSSSAGARIARSSRFEWRRCWYRSERDRVSAMSAPPGQVARKQLQVVEDGTQRERRKEGERADDEDDPDQQADEVRRVGAQRPRPFGDHLLAGHGTGQRQDRDDHHVAAEPHGGAAGRVVVDGVAGEAGERAAVVAGLRREGVQD